MMVDIWRKSSMIFFITLSIGQTETPLHDLEAVKNISLFLE